MFDILYFISVCFMFDHEGTTFVVSYSWPSSEVHYILGKIMLQRAKVIIIVDCKGHKCNFTQVAPCAYK